MAATLLDAARSLMTPDLVARARAQTGESDAAASKGLAAVIPLLVSTIASRSDDNAFMSRLVSLATKAAGDTSSFPEQPAVMAPRIDPSAAGNWLSTLFGGGMASVVEGIARYAGLGMTPASGTGGADGWMEAYA